MTSNIRNWSLAVLALVLGTGATALAQQQPSPVFAPLPAPTVAAAPGEPYGADQQHVLSSPAGQPMTPEETLRELEELQRRLAWCEAQLQASNSAPQAGSGGQAGYPAGYYSGNLPTPTTVLGTPANPPATIGNLPAPSDPPENVGCPTTPIISGPTLHIGAKAILDNALFDQSPANHKSVGTEEDLTGFRFLRIMFYGDLYENIDYRLEIDLAQAESSTNPALLAAFQDVWVHFKELPVLGNLKVGYFKEPYGLEQQTGEEYLLFMERSLPNAFVPARRIGIMAYSDLNDDHTLSWFTGTFREGSGDKTFLEYSNEGDYGTTSRLVWLPYYDTTTNGRYLAHLGAAYEFTGANTSNADSKTFSFTPEVNAQTNFGSVTIPCDTFQLFGAEAAVMDGPLLFMAEYMRAWMPDLSLHGQDVYCDGGYVEALYLLTGENHNYVMNGKFFRGVDPYEPFFRVRSGDNICTGWGAWEVGARVSFIDLNRFGLGGGDATDYTLGLHWYLTSNLSVMFNYIYSDLAKKGIDSNCDIYGTRIEWHF